MDRCRALSQGAICFPGGVLTRAFSGCVDAGKGGLIIAGDADGTEAVGIGAREARIFVKIMNVDLQSMNIAIKPELHARGFVM